MNLIDLVIALALALAQEYPTRVFSVALLRTSVVRVLFTNHIEALVGCRTRPAASYLSLPTFW